jgi:glycosyltransferase involved in cell wall biosynthesis
MSSSTSVYSSPIALLGRQDHPTNALRDYCECLAEALERRGIHLEIVEAFSRSQGPLSALFRLWRKSKDWSGRWILVQYTALSWSKRGFPITFLFLLLILKLRGTCVAILFHDPGTYSGNRFVDRARSAFQRYVMRSAYRTTNVSILTIPLEDVPWIPRDWSKAAFIPVGSNIPPPARSILNEPRKATEKKTIAVFSMTDGGIAPEIEDIAIAVKYVGQQIRRPRLVTLGRGSKRAEEKLRQRLSGVQAEFVALGLLSPEEISKTLAESDVLLFARGSLSAQRGSAIAGIACGLPIVAYSSLSPRPPLSEAGVLFVPQGDREELSRATARVLTDGKLWEELHERSLCAYEKYFSWDAIAAKFVKILFNDAT